MCDASRVVAAPQDEILLPGVVRDFQSDHPDFGIDPLLINGHIAGNVSYALSATGLPTFSGGGYFVSMQWRDLSSEPIAPHLYAASSGDVVQVVAGPTINNNPTIDTFNSTLGPYGGG
ncbi:MAG: hypothetical protein O7G85_04595, partial [Planctomycetota bacterium]|nr:hypothetical protein [Planctomycetota bacterium]